MPKMYSSEDLERFYFDYQTKWMPRGMSIQAYCSRNNVPYRVLDRWIKDIYKKIVPVQIAGAPEELKIENPQPTETAPKKKTSNEDVSIKIISVRVPAWNCPEMDWTTGVSGLSLKDWRACYDEHHRNEQVLIRISERVSILPQKDSKARRTVEGSES